jgi:iron complex outermembrane recepter protein
MAATGPFTRTACWAALACLAAATPASAGPDPSPADRAAPSSLALPARVVAWPSLPGLALWWQSAQPDAQPPPAPAPAPDPAAPADRAAPAPDPAAPAPDPSASAPDSAAPAAPTDAVPSDADVIAQAEAELAAGAEPGEVIIVTGSVIERRETTTPAPVSVLDKEELDAAGMVSIGDILQNLPSQSNAINVQANNGGDGSTRVDLRGLGAARTLVLLNGRRHVPGGLGADASVDLNAIPIAIIKRVEVLKDGASAVYGSDALGGVVNIITRDDFNGTEVNLYTGTAQRGDGTTIDGSFVTGQASRRGHVVFSGGYYDQRPVFADERGFAEVAHVYNFETGVPATSGSQTTPNGWLKVAPEEETFICEGQSTFGCTPDGMGGFRTFDDGGSSDRGEGDLWNFQPDNYLYTPSRRYNAFSSGSYQFHDKVRGFFEASYLNRKSDQRLAPEPLVTGTEAIVLSADSVYNPLNVDLPSVNRRMVEAGPRRFLQNNDTFRIVAGVDGRLPGDFLDSWRWEASFNYGRNQGTNVNEGRLIRSRVAAAIGPSYYDDDNVARCGTRDNPGPADCVPLDLLGGEGTITKEMMDYLTYTGTAEGFAQQRTLLGQVNGPLFTTPWNGSVILALGGDYREEQGGFTPDPITSSGDTTGNKGEPTFGGYDVVEGFGELSIVPVADQDWAKWLEINLAARAVDYSTFGSAFTWKTGILWRLPMGLAARGTYSTAFRAPSIGELYAGQADAFPRVSDPCNTSNGPTTDPNIRANCVEDLKGRADGFVDLRQQLPTLVGGNTLLQPETATVWTGGLVYEPPFIEGLDVSVDYFNIEIVDALQQAGSTILLANCYNLPPDQRSDCDKIERSPTTGEIVRIVDTQTNIGGTKTDGIDFSINYEHAYPEVGRFRHSLEGTWLHSFDAVFPTRTIEGVGVFDLGVFPRWKFNAATMWGFRGFGVGVNARYIHGFKECRGNDCAQEDANNLDRPIDYNVTGDVFTSYSLKSPAGTSTLTLGINNVTDQDPPVIYNGFAATSDSNTYDFMGRYLYARLVQLF